MTETSLVPVGRTHIEVRHQEFSSEEVALIKEQIAPDATDGELQLFVRRCEASGLDPFAGQIHCIVRGTGANRKMSIQTGIDGYRLIAHRTGLDAGQDDPEWLVRCNACSGAGFVRLEQVPHKCPICEGEGQRWVKAFVGDHAGQGAHPLAARVKVWKAGVSRPYVGIATWWEYAQWVPEYRWNGQKRVKTGNKVLANMWEKMGPHMLAKCFSPDTEVLTDQGFRRFSQVGDANVMQVSERGLEPVAVAPFRQDWSGPMVTVEGERLDFMVTPNHDMVTTFGKVEAGAMLSTTHSRGPWHVPMTAPGGGRPDDRSVSDDELVMLAAIMADGYRSHGRWAVSVSKQRKVERIGGLGLHLSSRIQHTKGSVADAGVRKIRSNFDKTLFTFADTPWLTEDKMLAPWIKLLSSRQARVLCDALVFFDGHENRKTGVRRFYSSHEGRLGQFELLAVMAGFSVSARKSRTSDLSDRPNYSVTITDRNPTIKVVNDAAGEGRPAIRAVDENPSGEVWCVTVPSGQIVVRRNGHSMVCGNCAEALGLRKAFPAELSGLYTEEEMAQSAMARDFRRQMLESGGYEVVDEVGRRVGVVLEDDDSVDPGFMRDDRGNVVPDPSNDAPSLGASPEAVEKITARARALPDGSRQRKDFGQFVASRGLDLRDPTTVPKDVIPILQRKLTALEKQIGKDGPGPVEPDAVANPTAEVPDPDPDPGEGDVIDVCGSCGNPVEAGHEPGCAEAPFDPPSEEEAGS